ncbi:hypothetical protein COB72_04165 [bacterium]|nr:MAG: hypothetical protein COB72_04165 [bacterium]
MELCMKRFGYFEQIKHGQVLGLSVLAMALHLGASNAMAMGDGGNGCVPSIELGSGTIADTSAPLFGLDIDGDYAFVVDLRRTMTAIDITDLSAPVMVGSMSLLGFAPFTRNVRVVDGVAYLTRQVTEGADFAGLLLIDVSSPESMSLMSVSRVDSAFNVEVDGNMAYVMNRTNQLHMIDVGDSFTPLLIGALTAPGVITDVDVVDGIAYMICEGVGLVVADVSDPTSAKILGSFEMPNSTLDIEVQGSIAYIADSDAGLMMIDIQVPTAPVFVDFRTIPNGAKQLSVSGDSVHVLENASDNNPGLWSFDISSGIPLGVYRGTSRWLNNVKAIGDTAFLVFQDEGSGAVEGLKTIDVTNLCNTSCPMDAPCPADLNHDGVLNSFDISAFLGFYNAQDLRADFTCDGYFNFFDLSLWLSEFSNGCQ